MLQEVFHLLGLAIAFIAGLAAAGFLLAYFQLAESGSHMKKKAADAHAQKQGWFTLGSVCAVLAILGGVVAYLTRPG